MGKILDLRGHLGGKHIDAVGLTCMDGHAVGEELFYEGCSENVRHRYGGGFVWDRNITSHYPDQGLRLPLHRYRERPDVLDCQEHAFEASQQEPDRTERMRCGGQELVGDGTKTAAQRCSGMRSAIAASRCRTSARRRRLTIIVRNAAYSRTSTTTPCCWACPRSGSGS